MHPRCYLRGGAPGSLVGIVPSRTEADLPNTALRRITEIARSERAPGIALSIATLAAVAWANVATSSYADIAESMRPAVNDGLMSALFLLVGLEIRREMVYGELARRRRD
jgi:Na+/H+ antiporter NhaA